VTSDPVFVAKDQVPNRFLLCAVAFERSKQLIKGGRPRVEGRFHSPVTTALDEIAQKHVVPGDPATSWKLA
jgi:DNA-directed RNA polymerase subunit K/omega